LPSCSSTYRPLDVRRNPSILLPRARWRKLHPISYLPRQILQNRFAQRPPEENLARQVPSLSQFPKTAKRMPCHWPFLTAQPHSRSLLRQSQCEASTSRSVFSFKPGRFRGLVNGPVFYPDSVRSGASTFPRIWIRSIRACENSVKRKTQYLA
jgi:hypothetical protein